MLFVNNKKPEKIKFFLLAVILIASGIILAVFVGYRRILNNNDMFVPSIHGEANIAMHKVNHTATRNGITEWNLSADSACLIDKKKQMILKKLSVIFFMKKGKKVYLTAEQGIFKTDSNDIEVKKNVVVKNDIYRLQTEKLHYRHSNRILFSKVPVKITGASFQLTADSISFDLNTNLTLFEGNVEGHFSENIIL
jgi:LPS export ABC transporter protein LptC